MIVDARGIPLHFRIELNHLRPRPDVACPPGTHTQVATSLLKGGSVALLQLVCGFRKRATVELGMTLGQIDLGSRAQLWK